MVAIYNDETMRAAMRRLFERNPQAVADLAGFGPFPEPLCAVCDVLLPIASEKVAGRAAAIDIICYHDDPVFDVEPEDYLKAIGLASIEVYRRCLAIYAYAVELLEGGSPMAGP